MKLDEVRKDDDLYFCGAFWIVANSVKDIYRGNFKVVGEKVLCDYCGFYAQDIPSKKALTHQRLWKDKYSKELDAEDKPYNYYPRGRVRIYDGTPFIHLNSMMNTPAVINAVIKYYGLQKLSKDIDIEEDDLLQGSHYNFELK